MAGFSDLDRIKLVFKVQAAGVIDAATNKQWYESKFAFNPNISADRVLTQFDVIKQNPVGSKSAALALLGTGNPLDGIVYDAYTSGNAIRLTQATTGDSRTWVACSTYGDLTTQLKDWIQPQKILQSNGNPSIGWGIEFWNGDPTSGGTLVNTTDYATPGGEVGWVFNYDNGMLFISDSTVSSIGSVNPYIRGFYYIGTTLVDFLGSSGIGGSGSSGSSGNNGTSGSSGTSGIDGSAGASGSAGTSGSSGTSGTDGTSGSSGTSGIDGSAGASGSAGTSGTDGTSGSSGTSGTDGTSGSAGTSGSSGTGSAVNVYQSGTSMATQVTGINFGSGLTVSSSGTSGIVNITAAGSGSVTFYDEGTLVGSYANVNFVGADILGAEKPGDPTTINVYVPTPTFASHFNTVDGTTTGTVSESGITRSTVRISTPTSEGTPFYTGGGANSLWAGTTAAAHTGTTPSFTTAGLVTGVGGNSTLKVEVFSADGVTLLATYTTPAITGNAVNTSSGPNAGITVTITNYATDSLKYKATLAASVNVSTIFTTNSLSGGRYRIKLTHTTDTTTDGAGTYTYTQTDVFYDKNTTSPSFGSGASITIAETSGQVQTKHISGVEYYIIGSQFTAIEDKINDLNANTQGRSGSASSNIIFAAANYGLATLSISAWSPSQGSMTGWTNYYDNTDDTYTVTNWAISSSSFRYRGTSGNATCSIYDPWSAGTSKTTSSTNILVDTISDNSTNLIEYFNGESYRMQSDYTTSWTSTNALSNGEACVVGSCIVRPDRFFLTDPNTSTIQPNLSAYKPDAGGANPNYTGYSNDASYYRLFYNTLAPSGTPIPSFSMVFAGTFSGANALADLASSALKVFVRKIGATLGNYGTTSPALYLHGTGYDNGTFDDGNTVHEIRLGTSSGNTINGTFGGFNATNGIYVEVRICNSAIKIDQITVTFN